MVQVEKISKINKRAGWNKIVQVGIFQKKKRIKRAACLFDTLE